MDYQILELIKQEHKEQGSLIPKLEILFDEIRNEINLDKLKTLQNTLKNTKQSLKEHFYIEETKLFPQILNLDNQLLIEGLIKEHIELLNLLTEIDKNIERILSKDNVWIELRYNIKEFLHTLNDHILKEDYQLLASI
jgi:hemerythrin-like domain-containing protein